MTWSPATPVVTPVSDRALARFLCRIGADPHGCFVWDAPADDGYGRFGWNGTKTSAPLRAHRVAYVWWVGPIPPGLQLDHLCRNRACVNPDHLEPVTQRENILRGESPTAVNAGRSHCVNGHPLTEDNVYRPPRGGRQCRPCKRFRDRLYAQRDRQVAS